MGSSPEIALGVASHQLRPLSKLTRKNISPKHSQSLPGKVSRQNSRTNSAKTPDSTTKKKRIGSGKKLKNNKLSSKSGQTRTGSKSGSRASSPKRNKFCDPKHQKLKVSQKKVLQKAALKSLEDPVSSDNVLMSNKKLKRKKKKGSILSS